MGNIEFEEIQPKEIGKPAHHLIPIDPHSASRVTAGDLGSLAETMGYDEANAFLNEHSLTRHSQRMAARRIGRPILRKSIDTQTLQV